LVVEHTFDDNHAVLPSPEDLKYKVLVRVNFELNFSDKIFLFSNQSKKAKRADSIIEIEQPEHTSFIEILTKVC